MTQIHDLMSESLQTAGPDDTVADTRALIQDIGVHALPVLDDQGHLAGIVTSIDLADELDGMATVASVMTDVVHTVRADTEVAMAASFMRGLQINHLVVTDDAAEVVGIVSAWDLLESLAASVRAHTVDAVEVGAVARGDELTLSRPDGTVWRCRIDDVQGPAGLPPYVVIWHDDPSTTATRIEIERNAALGLDGCER